MSEPLDLDRAFYLSSTVCPDYVSLGPCAEWGLEVAAMLRCAVVELREARAQALQELEDEA